MKIYIIRSKDGKFFRPMGYGGSGGANWNEFLDKAKIYTRIGPAKSQITWWFKNYPTYGCPDLLEFELDVSQANVLNMEEISQKSIKKIEKKKLEREKRQREYMRKSLEEQEEEIKRKLKELK